MRFAQLPFAVTLALSFSSLLALVSADAHDSVKRSKLHKRSASRAIDIRAPGHLAKRFDNARFSYYQDGLGACGKTNSPGDFIVALNSAQYDGGSHCFETITISYGGKTTQASIVDECPGCPFAGLDMSEGLFSFFAPESKGIIYGEWDFGAGAPAPSPTPTPTPTPKPKPHTTSTPPPPPPTTTSTKHTTSSAPPSTSSVPSTTSQAPSTTSSTPTTTSSAPAVTDASVATAGPDSSTGNLNSFNLALVQLGIFLDQAAKAQ